MKLITITGPSGAGKDTVARMLSEMSGYKVLCSYTTRPKREGEIDGVEHREEKVKILFISSMRTDSEQSSILPAELSLPISRISIRSRESHRRILRMHPDLLYRI